jgi:hypothetical protein
VEGLLVCAGSDPGVAVLEKTDLIVDPADNAAGSRLGRPIGRWGGGFEKGDVAG